MINDAIFVPSLAGGSALMGCILLLVEILLKN